MGRLVHFEIPADDPQRAIDFYEAVLGWSAQRYDAEVPYWLVSTGDESEPGINGAVMPREEGATSGAKGPRAFVCTAQVDDIDAALKSVEDNGGRYDGQRMTIPGVGEHAYVLDTEGNTFGLLQPDSA